MRLVCCWAGDPTSNHWRELQRLSMLGTRATGWGMKNLEGGRRSRKGATDNTKSTINRSSGGVVTSAEAVAMVTVAARVRAWENEKNEYNYVSVDGSDHFVGEYWHRPNRHVFCFPNLVSRLLSLMHTSSFASFPPSYRHPGSQEYEPNEVQCWHLPQTIIGEVGGNWRAKTFMIKLSRKQAAKVSQKMEVSGLCPRLWQLQHQDWERRVGRVLKAANYIIEIEREEWVVS